LFLFSLVFCSGFYTRHGKGFQHSSEEIREDLGDCGAVDGVVVAEEQVVVILGILLLHILVGNHMPLVKKDGDLAFGVEQLLEQLPDMLLAGQATDNKSHCSTTIEAVHGLGETVVTLSVHQAELVQAPAGLLPDMRAQGLDQHHEDSSR